MDADPRRHAEIPRLRHPRRQSGRRRHPRSDGVAAPEGSRRRPVLAPRRRALRRFVALRRWRPDAGDLRPRSDGRPHGGRARLRGDGRPRQRRHPHRSLLLPAPGHGRRWSGLRTRHADLVLHPGGSGALRRGPKSCRSRGLQSSPRDPLPRARRRRGIPRPGSRLPGRDRRRGSLRGSRTLRRAPDPDRLVLPRRRLAHPELLRSRGPRPVRSASRAEPLLPPRAGLVPAAAARSGDDGRDHRVSGDHLRLLLPHPAGGPTRLPAALRDHPHLGHGDRSDLHSDGQLDPRDRNGRGGDGLPQLEQRRQRLWRRADHHHAHHHAPGRSRRGEDLALEGLGRRPRHRGLPRAGPVLLRFAR